MKPLQNHSKRMMLTALWLAVNCVQGAHATESSNDWTIWQCWLERSTRIFCRLESAAAEQPPALDTQRLVPVVAPSGRLIAMNELARTILDRPGALQQRTLSIPLLSPPESHLGAEELAGAVMCADRIRCRVSFRSRYDPLADPAEFEDPALN